MRRCALGLQAAATGGPSASAPVPLRPPGAQAAPPHTAPRSDEAAAHEIRRTWYRGDGKGANAAGPLLKELAAMRKDGWAVGPKTYAAAITVLGLRRRAKQAERVHWTMIEGGIPPSAYTYAALLRAFIDGGRCDRVAYIWFKMQAAGVVPDRACYNALITALGRVNDAAGCRDAFAQMRERGIAATHETHTAMIQSCSTAADALEYMRTHLEAVGVTEAILTAVFQVCERTGDVAAADEVYRAHRGTHGSPQFICDYAKVYYYRAEFETAMRIVKRMHPMSRGGYELLLRAHAARRSPRDAFEHCLEAAFAEHEGHAPFYEVGIAYYMEVEDQEAAGALNRRWQARGIKPSPSLLGVANQLAI